MPIVTSAGVAGPLGLTGGLDVGAIRMAVEKEPSTCSVELGVSKLIPTFPVYFMVILICGVASLSGVVKNSKRVGISVPIEGSLSILARMDAPLM